MYRTFNRCYNLAPLFFNYGLYKHPREFTWIMAINKRFYAYAEDAIVYITVAHGITTMIDLYIGLFSCDYVSIAGMHRNVQHSGVFNSWILFQL
jgi:quinol-cytochrome oxidoreductase complex cytochrome b subunit